MSDQGNVYVQRINLVLDYIREHATEDLSVERLARVAAFSPHHFHRLFTTLTGETVNQCVVRMRLERAAALMKAAPTRPVTEIAATCGFTSLPVFSRGFKKQFGMSPTQWDRNSPLKDSKNRQALEGLSRYTIAELSEMSEQNAFAVTLRDMPAQRTAFIRVTDAYRPGRLEEAYDRLIAWVRAHGRMPTEFTLLGMSQDDPDVVPKALCRYDVCLTVPDTWTAGGGISIRTLRPCRLARVHCEGDITQVDRGIQYLYRYWLPRSGYVPDNLPAMEIYHRQPCEIGWDTFDLDCAVPVVAIGPNRKSKGRR